MFKHGYCLVISLGSRVSLVEREYEVHNVLSISRLHRKSKLDFSLCLTHPYVPSLHSRQAVGEMGVRLAGHVASGGVEGGGEGGRGG